VLINGRSASASEIVAGAIRDHKAGTLVGSDTFGKGLIQTIINLQDGSAVSITTAKYLTPAGRDVSKEKVHPDVVIEQTEEDIRADNDVQLKRAVQLLRERLGATQANLAEQEHRKS
jgi:carboxyl-terminal processing protease